jgi:hypothetical protein
VLALSGPSFELGTHVRLDAAARGTHGGQVIGALRLRLLLFLLLLAKIRR